MVRLGMAASLFHALRAKHPATAAKGLRVAIAASSWCDAMGIEASVRDRIEVAALLCDVGRIGIPDGLLRKPGDLSEEERLTMDLAPHIAVDILRGCTADTDLLDMVRYRPCWFQSRREGEGPQQKKLPLGARMLAIVTAFDSMTHDAVHRQAMTHEEAIGELFRGRGTQFDPTLTDDFVRIIATDPDQLRHAVRTRWLGDLERSRDAEIPVVPNASWDADSSWSSDASPSRPVVTTGQPGQMGQAGRVGRVGRADEILTHLLNQIDDGVIVTDTEGVIEHFNGRVACWTGLDAESVVGHPFDPKTISLRCHPGDDRCDVNDLIGRTLRGGGGRWNMQITDGRGQVQTVELEAGVIRSHAQYNLGVMLTLRDVTGEVQLQAELNTLQKKTVTDALTGVYNRAYFDQTLAQWIESCEAERTSLSVVICDIDHFKKVNDVHGHQAGDEALVSFGEVLREHARDGDVVARYGGEEFLMMATGCDIETMARRADEIREALTQTPLPSLNHESVTASFGVTQMERGDTVESIVERADRALLKAKDTGRNRVIQLGGNDRFVTMADQRGGGGWLRWLAGGEEARQEVDLLTPVPVDFAIEKLRGFVADLQAEIVTVNESQVTLLLNPCVTVGGRRRGDSVVNVRASLTLSGKKSTGRGNATRTNVHVLLETTRRRDRRSDATDAAFKKVLQSLRGYLGAEMAS